MPLQTKNYDPAEMYGAELDTSNIPASEIVTADIAAAAITGAKIATAKGYFVVATNLAATTVEYSLFGTGGLGVASTMTSIFCTSLDASAVTVSLTGGTATIATVELGGNTTTTMANGPNAAMASTGVAASTNVILENSAQGATMAVVTFEID